MFAEPWITGKEYTVAILQGSALPSIRIETPQTFYDYEAKYFRDDTRYFCPSGLSSRRRGSTCANLALAAFDAAGASGWGRADFMMDAAGRPLLLEINTIPGMTEPQPRADGRARGRHRLRRAGVARARDELHARTRRAAEERVNVLGTAEEPPQADAASAAVRLPAINWRALGTAVGAARRRVARSRRWSSWALDQPIETVAVDGRFQRVAPGGRRARR